jgi:hypothetical protein
VAKSCTICSSRSRRPVRKLLDTPSYVIRHYDCNRFRTGTNGELFWIREWTFPFYKRKGFSISTLRMKIGRKVN